MDVQAIETDGSSPLTRGKLLGVQQGRDLAGLIPAHAGKTALLHFVTRVFRAHPRSRGENWRRGAPVSMIGGSSPLTRGKRNTLGFRQHIHGLIPAHAGKTGCRRASRPVAWAHPRSRGENIDHKRVSFNASGSSPLTRGKQRGGAVHLERLGLIPAHAGKTCARRTAHRKSRAHPRSRGENHGGD